jgi:AbrB family looped-hinge helix DNA binding protein
MTHKVGMKGQVVIPKEIREELGIAPGDEVEFEAEGSEVRVRRVADARRARIEALGGVWADQPGLGTADLETERQEEREREDRESQRLLGNRP